MFSIRMSPLKTVKRTICEVLKEGEGETCQVDCSLRVRGGAATSLMFVFVSLETSDSAASRQQMFSSVCVYMGRRSGHTKLVRKCSCSWGNTSFPFFYTHTHIALHFPDYAIPFQETDALSFIQARFDSVELSKWQKVTNKTVRRSCQVQRFILISWTLITGLTMVMMWLRFNLLDCNNGICWCEWASCSLRLWDIHSFYLHVHWPGMLQWLHWDSEMVIIMW